MKTVEQLDRTDKSRKVRAISLAAKLIDAPTTRQVDKTALETLQALAGGAEIAPESSDYMEACLDYAGECAITHHNTAA